MTTPRDDGAATDDLYTKVVAEVARVGGKPIKHRVRTAAQNMLCNPRHAQPAGKGSRALIVKAKAGSVIVGTYDKVGAHHFLWNCTTATHAPPLPS